MKNILNYVAFFALMTAMLTGAPCAAGQAVEQTPATNLMSAAKFAPLPIAPQCFTIAVERGNPAAGPSVILAKFAPGCVAPYHWHTPSETAMMVSGSLELQMKGDKASVAHHGDFVYLPPHHVHRATCRGSVPCLVFLSSDGAFDIHWVDDAGQEIPLDAAMKGAKPASAPPAKK
jgi:quercetin dioxygenase-like cupin family protein